MPRLSCWFIKAALVHLAAGTTFGGLILIAKGLPTTFGWAWVLLPAHIQLVAGGWLIQLAFGVAYWILPRLDGTGARGRDVWAWTCFLAINFGVGASALLLLARPFMAGWWLSTGLVLAALAHIVAIGTFAVHLWPRLAPISTPAPSS